MGAVLDNQKYYYPVEKAGADYEFAKVNTNVQDDHTYNAPAVHGRLADNYVAFQKTVAASGTPEALKASEFLVDVWVTIQAMASNTNPVFVGNSAGQFHQLAAGESFQCFWHDLAQVYIKVTTNGEGVNVTGG